MSELDEEGDLPEEIEVDGDGADEVAPPDVNDAALDEEPAVKPRGPRDYSKSRMRVREDGTLNSTVAERCALLMADGITAWKAWQLHGGKDWGPSGLKARAMKGDPSFIERLETLMAEKEELERDPHWGSAKWAAAQMWRTARSLNDHAMAMEAVKILARLAEKSGVGMVAAPISPEIQPQPGKPSVDIQQTPKNGGEIVAIRAELLRLGKPAKVENAA